MSKNADDARRLGPSPWRDDWMPATKETLMDADPCWLCQDLRGIAIHEKWTAERGKPLWTAHAPASTQHPVYPCPACTHPQAPELVALAARLLHLRSFQPDDPHDEELRRVAVRLRELADSAAPRASQAATATNGPGDDAGAAHDPHKPAAGHTEPRMRPEDVPEEPELDAKDLEIAEAHDALMANLKRAETAEAERDQFADAIAWEIQLHTQSTGPHQDLDLPACQRCRTYRELRELPAVRAASERLRQGIADAIRDGLAIVCRIPEEDQ